MRRPRLTMQQRRLVRELRREGKKLREIAAAIGCSRQTVTRVLHGPDKRESQQMMWSPGPARPALAEREEICLGLRGGDALHAIRERLGRASCLLTSPSPSQTGPTA